jgi:hypothetical protein
MNSSSTYFFSWNNNHIIIATHIFTNTNPEAGAWLTTFAAAPLPHTPPPSVTSSDPLSMSTSLPPPLSFRRTLTARGQNEPTTRQSGTNTGGGSNDRSNDRIAGGKERRLARAGAGACFQGVFRVFSGCFQGVFRGAGY